jgi:hypothetical protein
VGGGFGVLGSIEGMLVAKALNSATRRTTTSVQTFIHLNARNRELMMLDGYTTPQVLQVRLAPAFARIKHANVPTATPPDASRDRLALLRELGELRQSGVLTEAEFEAEKARLLSSS